MIKTHLIHKVIGEMLKQYSMNEKEIEQAKLELREKDEKDLETFLKELEEKNK